MKLYPILECLITVKEFYHLIKCIALSQTNFLKCILHCFVDEEDSGRSDVGEAR